MSRILLKKPFVLVVALAVTGMAGAAIVVTYTNATAITTSVREAPVQFAAGDDAGPSALSSYVTSYSISTNKTYVSTTVKGVPESTLVIDSFFKLQNVDTVSRTVTLATSKVTNSYVTAYKIEIYDSSNTLKDTLTLTAAAPSAQFAMAAGTTYSAKLTLGLASGAGANNVALTSSVSLSVA